MIVMIIKFFGLMEDQVLVIMENVFECILEMINKDFFEFLEYCVEFFNLFCVINFYCFFVFLKFDNCQFKFVIDLCLWVSKYDNCDVEIVGFNMCLELINNIVEKIDVVILNVFFQQFFIFIFQDVFFVLMDQDYKVGFKIQFMFLMCMFYFISFVDGIQFKIQGFIYILDQVQGFFSNKEFFGLFVSNFFQNVFFNLIV